MMFWFEDYVLQHFLLLNDSVFRISLIKGIIIKLTIILKMLESKKMKSRRKKGISALTFGIIIAILVVVGIILSWLYDPAVSTPDTTRILILVPGFFLILFFGWILGKYLFNMR